mmetsp:Transcript_46044/g.139752  ORF Transcript_46044/g.139752 Transcript_46044/m.139752 type:complete len:190 (-) Transcript_46044:963-1532(-)
MHATTSNQKRSWRLDHIPQTTKGVANFVAEHYLHATSTVRICSVACTFPPSAKTTALDRCTEADHSMPSCIFPYYPFGSAGVSYLPQHNVERPLRQAGRESARFPPDSMTRGALHVLQMTEREKKVIVPSSFGERGRSPGDAASRDPAAESAAAPRNPFEVPCVRGRSDALQRGDAQSSRGGEDAGVLP